MIDDEAAIRDSLRMILEYEDYEFVGSPSGTDGIALVKREPPDMVVLDMATVGKGNAPQVVATRAREAGDCS